MRRHRRFIEFVTFLLVIAAAFNVPAGSTGAQDRVNPPVLTGAWVTPVDPCMLIVHGTDFTPGGKVFIAVLDPWGEQLNETRWTTASEGTLDADRSIEPNIGFDVGGVIYENFGPICGQQVMVRAFDQGTEAWTNVVDIIAIGLPGQALSTG